MASTAKQGPGRVSKKGGRVTPSTKGGSSKGGSPTGSVQSNRYTPPIDRSAKTSPRWFGILILVLFLLGVLIVILNYAGLLPGGVNNLWLLAAIGSIFAGLLLATRYH
ncbi:MAG TPA: cell division protein CrgA [Acidimicrobiales bacterium]